MKNKKLILRNVFGKKVAVNIGGSDSVSPSSDDSNNIAPKTFLFNEVFSSDDVQPKVGDDISISITDAAWDTMMSEAEIEEKVNIYDASTGIMYVVVYGGDDCIVNSIVDSNKSIDWIYDDYTGIYWTKQGDKAIMLGQASIEHYQIVTGTVGSGNVPTSFDATVMLNPYYYTKFKTKQSALPEDIISVGEAAITSITFILPDSIINSIFYPLMVFSGRFIAHSDDITITLPNSITWADSNPSIEANHHYEWSIMDGVFTIIDVTVTSEEPEQLENNG